MATKRVSMAVLESLPELPSKLLVCPFYPVVQNLRIRNGEEHGKAYLCNGRPGKCRYIIEETRVNGINYLLVTESEDEEDEEAEAYILKDTSKAEDTEAVYEFVESEEELDAVSRIFAELLEDMDLEQFQRC